MISDTLRLYIISKIDCSFHCVVSEKTEMLQKNVKEDGLNCCENYCHSEATEEFVAGEKCFSEKCAHQITNK